MSNPNINNKRLRQKNQELIDDIKTLITPPDSEINSYHDHYVKTLAKWVEYFRKEREKRLIKV